MNFKDSLDSKKFNNEKQDCDNKKLKDTEKEFIENVNKYKMYSHNDLMDEFIKKTNDMKRRGELNNEKINEIYNSLEPVLNEEQKKNLKELLKGI